jgi:hypothetical protein
MAKSARKIGSTSGEKWWVPIIVALIGMVGLVWAAYVGSGSSSGMLSAPTSTFRYQVRVQSQLSPEGIPDAKVTIDVGGIAPLDDFTDSNGLAVFDIDESRVGKSGRLMVDAPKYQSLSQNIDLLQDALPKIIRLEVLP